MIRAGIDQMLQLVGSKVDGFPLQTLNKGRCPGPVPGVAAVVEAFRIVQKGKEPHHPGIRTGVFGQSQAVFADPLPMREAMDAVGG